MKLQTNLRNIVIDIICLLFVLLFVYAAVSKLLDFENFKVQLGQSPLLSAFASWISWLIPLVELLIATALVLPKWKHLGLFAALSLMTMFTAYIYIVLHYSSFVPCSCGGILEKMSWNVHLLFNIIFVVLALLALVMCQKHRFQKEEYRKRVLFVFKSVTMTMGFSILCVIILFIYSEEIMHYENPFIRRYPQHPIRVEKTIDLKFNSYYFAGFANEQIYLGNYTDPLHLLALDSDLKIKKNIKINFEAQDLRFKMVRITVRDSYFYLMDGTVPCLFRGKISDWKITKEFKGTPYFTIAEPLDSLTIAMRSLKGKNAVHVLGVFSATMVPQIRYNPKLLEQQIDGIFDTDGILLSDAKTKKIVYVYYYRNQYIIADQKGDLLLRDNTIDTISQAQIKVAYLKNKTERKMSAPPMMVNQKAVLYHNILFIQSKIPGRFEPANIWKQAAIIDVYNIEKNSYLMSFAIYGADGKKLSSLFVTKTHLYAIIEEKLVVYSLENVLKNEIN